MKLMSIKGIASEGNMKLRQKALQYDKMLRK